jgi:hypothetical protein
VPNVTNIKSGVLPDVKWASRLGASCPRVGFLGTGLPAAGGIGTSAVVVHAVPRVRGEVAFIAPPQTDAVTAQLVQAKNIYNYMTSVNAVGEGASGPPTYREPA